MNSIKLIQAWKVSNSGEIVVGQGFSIKKYSDTISSVEESNIFISNENVLFYDSWQFKIFFSLDKAELYSKEKRKQDKQYYLNKIKEYQEILKGL